MTTKTQMLLPVPVVINLLFLMLKTIFVVFLFGRFSNDT
jgi:hypothetical protein